METILTRRDNVGFGLCDSIHWAIETHLKQTDGGCYNFAILYGNEDAPERIEFWRSRKPLHHSTPDLVWEDLCAK